MPTIESTKLKQFIEDLALGIGTPENTAIHIADSLVTSNLRGHDSHGVRRLPVYYSWSQDDTRRTMVIKPEATPEVTFETETIAQVDGRFSFGPTVGRLATSLLQQKASEYGMGVVGIRNASHIGRIGEWAENITETGLMFGAFVNSQGGRLVAPPGSVERRYTTNPISFGVPTFSALPFSIVMDMATSQVAHGKIQERISTEEPIDPSWTITDDGQSVSGPEAFSHEGEGALLPLGGRSVGYKGFSLAMIAELFAAITGDGLVVSQANGRVLGNAALFFAIDPLAFSSKSEIEDRIESLKSYIEETEYKPEVAMGSTAYGDRAYLPGEPEYYITQERLESGIPIPAPDASQLVNVANDVNVTDIPGEFRK